MSRILSDQEKFLAVGEALCEMGTLTSIAKKYGLSIGYLSLLTSRARNAIGSGQQMKMSKRHGASSEIARLVKRLSNLESKINTIFK